MLLPSPTQANLQPQERRVSADAEEWKSKLVAVWGASRLLEVQQGTRGEGLRLVAELGDGSLLHLVVKQRAVVLCTLWNGQGGVIWDDFGDFPVKNLIRRYGHGRRCRVHRRRTRPVGGVDGKGALRSRQG